jgi:hypothetical protein
VISDGQGGSATGLVTVAVQPDPVWNDLMNISTAVGNSLTIQLTGLPGFSYTIQYSDTLYPAAWQKLLAATANESGLIEIAVPNPGAAGPRFYRAVRGVMP